MALQTPYAAGDVRDPAVLDLNVLLRQELGATAEWMRATPGSVREVGPGILRWSTREPSVQGRVLFAKLAPDLLATLTDYSRVGQTRLRMRGDGLLLLKVRLEGEPSVDGVAGRECGRAMLMYFRGAAMQESHVVPQGRWRTLALIGTPAAFDARWGLGGPLLAALGPLEADRWPPEAVVRRAWQVTPEGLDIVRALLECRAEGAVARAYFDARAAQLVCEFLSAGPDLGQAVPRTARVREAAHRARELLTADPARPHTLGSIAREVGVSRTVLAQRFRAEFGETLHAAMTRERLRLAWDSLRGSGGKIASIAASVGYTNAASFTRAFKAQFGITPREVGARQHGPGARRS